MWNSLSKFKTNPRILRGIDIDQRFHCSFHEHKQDTFCNMWTEQRCWKWSCRWNNLRTTPILLERIRHHDKEFSLSKLSRWWKWEWCNQLQSQKLEFLNKSAFQLRSMSCKQCLELHSKSRNCLVSQIWSSQCLRLVSEKEMKQQQHKQTQTERKLNPPQSSPITAEAAEVTGQKNLLPFTFTLKDRAVSLRNGGSSQWNVFPEKSLSKVRKPNFNKFLTSESSASYPESHLCLSLFLRKCCKINPCRVRM